MTTPLSLPKMSKAKALSDNQIYGLQRPIAFTLGSEQFTLQFSTTPESTDAEAILGITIKSGTDRFWLGLDSMPDISKLSTAYDGINPTDLPEDMQALIAQVMLQPILDNLKEVAHHELDIESVVSKCPVEDVEEPLFFRICAVDGEQQTWVTGRLVGNAQLRKILAAWMKDIPLTVYTNFDTIPLDLIIYAGRTALPYNDFSNLKPQDVILCDQPSKHEQGYCFGVVDQRMSFQASYEGNSITVKTDITESIMSDTEENIAEEQHDEDVESIHDDFDESDVNGEHMPKEESSAAKPTSQLDPALAGTPLNIVFEVGRTQLPLSELQSIKQGYTFDLENPIDHAVTIRANGKVIGSGELVQVDNRVGVRVIAFNNS